MLKQKVKQVAAVSLSVLMMLSLMGTSYALDGGDIKETVSGGVTVVADENSASGYTAHFVYQPSHDERLEIQAGEIVSGVQVVGSFRLLSGDAAMSENSDHGLDNYVNGDYCANVHPHTRDSNTPGIWGYQWPFDMTNVDGTIYTLDIPMISGAHQYSYAVTIKNADGGTRKVTIDDPKNPSPCRLNEANSNSPTGDANCSIVYGKWHAEKQSKSPNLDYLNPSEGVKGTLKYDTYGGTLASDQDIGVYLPPNYDKNRKEPYKVIYLSHGAGGNETYWYAMGQAHNSMDSIIAEDSSQEAIVVGLDNTLYSWDYYKIAQNVLTKVIPYMEANYNVSNEAKDRAFSGFSMGSMTTTYMAFHHADQFGYFGIFSGCNIGNATFKDGFVYDRNKFNTDENYIREVYDNIEPSEDLLNSVVFTMAGTSDTAIYSNGFSRYGAYETIRDWCAENMPKDNFVDGGLVPGSHDLYTWGQCFYTFAKDIAWSKDVVEQPEIKVSLNITDAEVKQGDTKQFIATVETVAKLDTSVTWKVSGALSANTKIDGNGLLTIGIDEKVGTKIIVEATAVADSTKTAKATVTVQAKETNQPVVPNDSPKQESGNIVKTGDNENIGFYAILSFLSVAAVGSMFVLKKRKGIE
ncbi:MAG: alpha/beta hydrolase-fold protein [Coprobacillus sp.]